MKKLSYRTDHISLQLLKVVIILALYVSFYYLYRICLSCLVKIELIGTRIGITTEIL